VKIVVVALTIVILALFAAAVASVSQETVRSGTLLPFMDDKGCWGFMDRSGKIVIPATYDSASAFSEGIALVWEDGYPEYIDRNGTIIWSSSLDPHLDFDEDDLLEYTMELGRFQEGLTRVKIEGLFGFIDKAGKFVIKPQFSSAGNFSEGLAAAKTSGGYGYMRKDGSFAIKPQYKDAGMFSEGLAPVMLGEKWIYIDKAGAAIIQTPYDKAGNFSEGLASFGVRNPGEKRKSGVFTGVIESFNFPGKWGYIDKAGSILIGAQYDEAKDFSEGLAAVRKGKLWGYIDKTGDFLIEPQFDLTTLFSEGLAAVYKGGKWGYVDKSGRMPISPQFDKAGDFFNGLAMVWLDKKMGYILPTGKFFWGPSK